MTNKFIILAIAVLALLSCNKEKEPKNINNTKDNIVFAVPFAPVAYPILKMMEDGSLETNTKKTELILWKTPDQLKALVAGGQADIFAVPSNVGATFYNKGIDVKLLNISIWRAIWLISRSDDKKTLADFKGEEIAMPFKGDMPHIVFMELAKKQGLDPEKDFKLTYVPSPMDAAKKMIMRKADNALLIDPAVSMVLEKSKSGLSSIVAPDIYRSVDIQNEWGRLFNTDNEIPFAGIMAGSEILKSPKLLIKFNKEYKKAAKWCMENPEATAKMVVKYIPQLNEKAVAEAMRNVILKSINAKDVQPKLEEFFGILHKSKPELIGGKLPDDNFYFNSKKSPSDKIKIRPTTLPAYMSFVMKNITELNISKEQKQKLEIIKTEIQPIAMPIVKSIFKNVEIIKKMSLSNKSAIKIQAFNKTITNARVELANVKTDCRNQIKKVLTNEQWTNLVAKFKKENVYEAGNSLKRISPTPNYMLRIFGTELNITEKQSKQLEDWRTKGHKHGETGMAVFTKITDLEKEIQDLSLNNASKKEIIKKVEKMEELRHNLLIHKSECRDNLKKNVLTNEQWNKVIATFN